jgi:hypothetical protein
VDIFHRLFDVVNFTYKWIILATLRSTVGARIIGHQPAFAFSF